MAGQDLHLDVDARLIELGYRSITFTMPDATGGPVRVYATRSKDRGGGTYQGVGLGMADALAQLCWPNLVKRVRRGPVRLDTTDDDGSDS